eukprot:GEMP01036386.1.p1 GENE.GEMP01036386.1~~GEMP01036386.1.p1  ORF type:complete len:323 (+),score=61.02 GEMP01036386.1:25-993(+)
MDYWEDRASRVLDQYRLLPDDRRQVEPEALRSNELVEVAFQTAAQLIVGMLQPATNPLFPRRLLDKAPRVSFSTLFLSAFFAKMTLDFGMRFELAILRWLPRLPRAQMLTPWHRINLELTCMSTLIGLGLGHLASIMGRSFERGHHQLFDRLWIGGTSVFMRIPRFLFRDTAGRFLKHIPLCLTVGLAPLVVQTLIGLSKEAQQRRRFITRVAIACVRQRAFWNFKHIWKKRPEWREGDVPIPLDMLCPITRLLFVDPVIINGHVFERHAAEQWITKKCRHPILNTMCTLEDIKPATEMKELVKDFAAQNSLQLRLPDSDQE